MQKGKKPQTIKQYISSFPPEVQASLKKIHTLIEKIVPTATQKISYGIPTFTFHGNLVHYAAFESHIGFYPGPAAVEEFAEKLEKYETSKGTIRFPLDKALPVTLIRNIVKFCVKARLAKVKKVVS